MNHQQVLEISLIPGKAIVGGERGDNIAAWALLCAIGWQTTEFNRRKILSTHTSLFNIPNKDLHELLQYRRHEIDKIEALLKIKVKNFAALRALCVNNPGIAAAIGYINLTYFLSSFPGPDDWVASWKCYKRVSPQMHSNYQRRFDGPAQWAISHTNGWALARKLSQTDEVSH